MATSGTTRRYVERFRASVAEVLGLSFDDGRLDDLADTLSRRVEESGSRTGSRYLDRLTSGAGWPEEWRTLAGRLTVGETYFFRYRDHFRAFSEAVLPALLCGDGGRLRLLSGGCASGDEAYSLAMLVRERFPLACAAGQVVIRGIDVNPSMIERAVSGHYSPWALRETPPELVERHFRRDGQTFVLGAAVRSMVSFGEGNLIDDDPAVWGSEAWDVVFCRNVLMYFAPEAARAVVARLERTLRPGGFLFLGHAETLRGLSEAFHLRHTHETFYYQRREAAERRPLVGARPAAPQPALDPAALAADTSWVDAIRLASARIATLAEAPQQKAAPPLAPAAAALDLGVAVELLRQERFADALERLRALPPEWRTDADAALLHAALLTHAGSLAEAEEACRELLERDEMNAGAHYLTSLCREHAGDRQGAVEHDQTAVYLDPTFAMPRLHLGLLAKRMGDVETARHELGHAQELLAREDASRILLFGGGFSREALVEMCRAQLARCGASP